MKSWNYTCINTISYRKWNKGTKKPIIKVDYLRNFEKDTYFDGAASLNNELTRNQHNLTSLTPLSPFISELRSGKRSTDRGLHKLVIGVEWQRRSNFKKRIPFSLFHESSFGQCSLWLIFLFFLAIVYGFFLGIRHIMHFGNACGFWCFCWNKCYYIAGCNKCSFVNFYRITPSMVTPGISQSWICEHISQEIF